MKGNIITVKINSIKGKRQRRDILTEVLIGFGIGVVVGVIVLLVYCRMEEPL